MQGRRLLHSMSLKNVLSFGPEEQRIEFEPLNVLIGPNGSGKSNLIEIIGLLKAMPGDLSEAIRERGGIRDWLWKGEESSSPAEIETEWDYLEATQLLRHRVILGEGQNSTRVQLVGEIVEAREPNTNNYVTQYRYSAIHSIDNSPAPMLSVTAADDIHRWFRPGRSVISLLRGPADYRGITYLGDRYSEIQLYRDWVFGPSSPLRAPQLADLPTDHLAEDARNLFVTIRKLQSNPETINNFLEALQTIYHGIRGFVVREIGEYIEFLMLEDHERRISARRLSDGTFRFLSILAILCDPTPAPLISIEEPELGLHPDVIPTIARLLIEASSRTQIIVTTHSADLISALWECPEAVVVCERGDSGTTLRRLEPEKMERWLEKYKLGELWLSGEIGGTR